MIPTEFDLTVGSAAPVQLTHTVDIGDNLLIVMGIILGAVVITRLRR